MVCELNVPSAKLIAFPSPRKPGQRFDHIQPRIFPRPAKIGARLTGLLHQHHDQAGVWPLVPPIRLRIVLV